VGAHVGLALWAENEFTQPEGIVATQVRHFAGTGGLYFGLAGYPYTVSAYMPLFYGVAAGLVKLGLPVLLADRLLSIVSLVALVWLAGRIGGVYGLGRLEQRMASALVGMTQVVVSWGTVGQVDTLAIACSLAAFWQYGRFARAGANSLDGAAGFALAGLLTKQTAVAAPVVIFLLLLGAGQRRQAWRFAGIVGGLGGAMVLGLNWGLEGRFLANTVFANLNPFALSKLEMPLTYFGVVLAPLLAPVVAGLGAARRDGCLAPYGYLGAALGVFLLTAGKVGADANYLLESAVVLVITAMVGLGRLGFFELFARGSRSWVTLLVLPVGVFVLQNVRVGVSGWVARYGREREFAAQVAGVKPFLAGEGRVLSADSNVLLRGGRSFEVEPLIYRLLVEARRIDGRRVERDLEAGVFRTIVLYDDVRFAADPDPEVPRLPEGQRAAIRRRYELVRHVTGPYLGGLYVYQPQGAKPW
jgi:hypothetical protein